MRSLAALPKAHLHLHLEGCMRPATAAELARRAGLPLPGALRFADFADIVSAYGQLCALLCGEADLRRVVRELLGDAAAAGAVYVEPQLCPPLLRQLAARC